MMTEQDVLLDAMESPPDFEPSPLDLGPIMAAGGRLRRRRTVAMGAASFLVVGALFLAGNQLMRIPGSPELSGAPSTWSSAGPVPSAINSSAPGILGRVVETGRKFGDRRWILYVETVDPDKLDDNLTLVLGRTKTGYIDDFTKDIVASDPGAGRMRPGFHAVEPGRIINGRTTPTFGYYAGEPAKITAKNSLTGKEVVAHLAAWTGFGPREKTQIFWFDFDQLKETVTLTDLTAYDRNGVKLPA